MKYVHSNASIECDGAEIVSRKISPTTAIQLKNIGLCKKYNCSRNSEAHILKPLSGGAALFDKNAAIVMADCLESENLTFYVNTLKKIDIGLVNHTGSHKAQIVKTKVYTRAVITLPFPNIPRLREAVNNNEGKRIGESDSK